MKYLYTNELMRNLKKKRNINLTLLIFFVIFATLFETILIYKFSREPYGANNRIIYQVIMYSFTIISVFGIIFYLEIFYLKYRRYYLLIIDCVTSQRTTSEATVLRINHDLNDKNGIDFTSIDVLEWSSIKNDYVERTLSVDSKFETNLNPNDMIKIITANGVLLAYEVKNNEKK